MPKSYRIRTQVGVDKNVNVQIDQDFDLLEILSLKITQSEIYARSCSDYGVIAGRVFINDGYGVPNARVSIFIPLSAEDETNPVISTLYPYKSLTDVNEDGYRYNLLPYVQSYSNHVPTGTFPERIDVLINKPLIEVYDKYYRFTVRTNDSGDFMIFGVPVGQHQLFMDVDLSDIGEFSLAPQDMIRLGLATEEQVSGLKFKESNNLYELPQIKSLTSSVDVLPFWGDPDICQISITRNDFDLSELGIRLEPSAIFMGSLISTADSYAVKKYDFNKQFCKVRIKSGELCRLVTGPGEIVAIRQTIQYDTLNRPILEQYELEEKGKVIDENGTWLVDLPMNMDYIITDEFGNQIISNDPTKGVPTTAKYRFKIKWGQPTNQNNEIQRGYFLVPNIKEWGWTNSTSDPNAHTETSSTGVLGVSPVVPFNLAAYQSLQANYAFSLDWNEYGDPNNPTNSQQQIAEAIACDDRFYKFHYNKVYSVSQFIDQYRGGRAARKFNSIKNILDDTCEDTVNPFPTNDAQFRGDFLYLLFTVFLRILTPVFIVIMFIQHILAFLLYLLRPIIWFTAMVVGYINYGICQMLNGFRQLFGGQRHDCKSPSEIRKEADDLANLYKKFTNLALPNLSYPDCEMCNCKTGPAGYEETDPYQNQMQQYSASLSNVSYLSDWNVAIMYDDLRSHISETTPPRSYWPSDQFYEPVSLLMAGFPFSGNSSLVGISASDPNRFLKDFTTVILGETVTYTFQRNDKSGRNCNSEDPTSCGPDDKRSLTRNRTWITPNLPMAERLNLFNTKAKYFNALAKGVGTDNDGDTALFGGGVREGVNQIRVTFNSITPNNFGRSHLDNVMILSCDDGTLGDFTAGNLVYFNGFQYSKDINALSASTNNPDGLPSITGQSIVGNTIITTPTFTTNVTVTWANPDNELLSNTTSYVITANTEDTAYHRWPVDVEYFQVITAMTVSDFLVKSNPNADKNTFVKRFLNNNSHIYKQASGNHGTCCWWGVDYIRSVYRPFIYADFDDSSDNTICYRPSKGGYSSSWITTYRGYLNPISGASTGRQQVIVILSRGVDPYSTRNVNDYDLSKLFGWNFGQGPIVRGLYKLNIPIQPRFRNARHNEIGTNTSTSSYSNSTIYYDTYNYLPGNDYSAFTSNLGGYYSSMDAGSLTVGVFPPIGFHPPPGGHTFGFTPGPGGDLRVFGGIVSNTNTGDMPFPQDNYNMMTIDFTYPIRTIISSIECGDPGFGGGDCDGNKKDCFECDGNWIAQDNYYRSRTSPASDQSGTKGYYRNESVEGGSLLAFRLAHYDDNQGPEIGLGQLCEGCYCEWNPGSSASALANRYMQFDPKGFYYSFGYNTGLGNSVNTLFQNTNNSQKRRIVMRSDRLPTSTTELKHSYNSYLIHQNSGFSIYVIEDDGTAITVPVTTIGFNDVLGDPASANTISQFANVVDTLNECDQMLPLKCYYVDSNDELQYDPDRTQDVNWNGTCTTFRALSKEKPIFQRGQGCYLLVTRPLLSIRVDLILLLEWKSRLDLTFAACRNVISHLFTNNWINGVLYAYSFKYDTLYTSPFSPAGNSPVNIYCYDTVYYHPITKNFYYRSAPYLYTTNNQRFIGKQGSFNLPGGGARPYGGNRNYINNPTTIIDLGPRSSYMNSLVNSNVFDAYNINNLNNSTFKETDDLINIFILSRLINANFWNLLFGSNGAGVFGLFSRIPRTLLPNNLQKNFVDGDFAQLISINSELGTSGFDSDNVGGAQNPVIIEIGTNARETVIGVYFDSNTQIRDYVTPYRKIYNNNALINNPLAFEIISTGFMTQVVPTYGWNMNLNQSPTIFGTQQNDWDSSAIKALPYQRQDRMNQFQQPVLTNLPFNGQNYFNYMLSQNTGSLPSQFFRGYIYAALMNLNPPPDVLTSNNPTQDVYLGALSNYPLIIQVGAPFHFYFGLIKGGTAFDRFYTKWVDPELL